MQHIEDAIRPFKLLLAKAADVIVTEDVSRYPIFIMFQGEINAGLSVVNMDEHQSVWNINASTLEEFYTKKLIAAENIDAFREVYKKHADELCIFVMDENAANFIFLRA